MSMILTKKFYARRIWLISTNKVYVMICLGNQVSQYETIMEGFLRDNVEIKGTNFSHSQLEYETENSWKNAENTEFSVRES